MYYTELVNKKGEVVNQASLKVKELMDVAKRATSYAEGVLTLKDGFHIRVTCDEVMDKRLDKIVNKNNLLFAFEHRNDIA